MPVLPLVLGVTGHRDIDPGDVEVVTAAVEHLFEHLAGRWPSTPLVLLSALAEGSDRIVARAAEASGVRIVCPLPMRVAEYRRTFSCERARLEFDGWLERVPHPVLAPADSAGQFRGLSTALAVFSHILIAVWDGASADTPGGTADTVRMRLYAAESVRPSNDLVYHVRVRRSASAPLSADSSRERTRFLTACTASSELPAASADLFEALNRFNAASGGEVPETPGLRPFLASAKWLDAVLAGQSWQ